MAKPEAKKSRRSSKRPSGAQSKLSEYRRKRRFDETPEPEPEPVRNAAGNRFVVQMHDATRLHYDFRLEIGGVLKSWAVPKGPSLNPADKRLAMETEDHPLEYAGFEGVIPEGHYGAGPVIVWDRGTFSPEGGLPAAKQYERGEMKFSLQGQKLSGGFALVKIHGRDGKGKPWLLIKHRDEAADPNWDISGHGGSVASGRSLKEVEEDLPADSLSGLEPSDEPEGARKAAMQSSVSPMLATLVDKPFSSPDWIFEIKWDGVRCLAWINDGNITLRSRTGRTITAQYPELANLPDHVSAKSAILDGEIVALKENGISSFERLQSRMNVREPSRELQRRVPVTYFIFDLLYRDGYDLRRTPLLQRKMALTDILRPDSRFRYTDHQPERGREFFQVAREHGLEGVVGKEVHSGYTEARSSNWVKFKITREVDAVIGGYTAPRGSREYFGALLAGLYDGNALRFIGGVGTGFDQTLQAEIYKRLEKLKATRCPFAEAPDTREKAYWVSPQLVARLKYANWTTERHLRAPVFLGLLEDHRPQDCRFDTQAPAQVAPGFSPARAALKGGATKTPAKSPANPPKTKKRKPSAPAHRESSPSQPSPRNVEHTFTNRPEIEDVLARGHEENLSIEIDGHPLRLTHLNKIYFPEHGYKKRDLLSYYCGMADYILPFLKDRPLILKRYPDGINGEFFFQKNADGGAQEWMETVRVPSGNEAGVIDYFIANDLASLLYLTNLGCIDHNPLSARRDDLEHPDYIFFDLDPSEGTDFQAVVKIARSVYEKLTSLKIEPFLKTSGATGFHLYVPLERAYTFEQVRMFAELIGRMVADEHPREVTQQRIISKRPRGTVMIDAYQNSAGKPLAAAYSVRAFSGAPVSAPISSSELTRRLRPERFNMKAMPRRIAQSGDLWADFGNHRYRIEPALARL